MKIFRFKCLFFALAGTFSWQSIVFAEEVFQLEEAIEASINCVEKEIGYDWAITNAQAGILAEDEKTRLAAIRLFEALFAKDQGKKEATVAVCKGFEVTEFLGTSFILLKKLLEKGWEKEPVVTICKGVGSENEERSKKYQHLLSLCCENNIGIKPICDFLCIQPWEQKERNKKIWTILDEYRREEWLSEPFYINAVYYFNNLAELRTLVREKNIHFEEALEEATFYLRSSNEYLKNEAFFLFQALVEEGKFYDEAIEACILAAQQDIEEFDELEEILEELIEALIAQGADCKEIVKAANACISDVAQSKCSQEFFLEIFTVFVVEGLFYDEALSAAQKGLESEDLRNSALQIYFALVWFEQYYEEAYEVAKLAIKDEDLWIREGALKLFAVLVLKGNYFKEAYEAAKAGLEDEDSNIRWHALELFETLVFKGNYFKEAYEAAKVGLEDEHSSNVSAATSILWALVNMEQYYEEAFVVAQEKMVRFPHKSLLIMYSLVVKDQYVDEILEIAADQYIQNNDSSRTGAFWVFSAAFEKGVGFQQAIDASITSIEKRITKGWFNFINYDFLYEELIKTKEGKEAAIQAARIQGESVAERMASLLLFQALLNKGLVLEEGFKAAIDGWNDSSIDLRRAGARFFLNASRSGRMTPEAIKIAEVALKEDDSYLHALGYLLFTFFVHNSFEVDKAIEVLSHKISLENERDVFGAFLLADALLSAGEGLDEVLEVAKKWARCKATKSYAYHLFDLMKEQGIFTDEAEKFLNWNRSFGADWIGEFIQAMKTGFKPNEDSDWWWEDVPSSLWNYSENLLRRPR